MVGYPIIVRMDDICPRMNLQKFAQYYHMLEELEIKPLLGVIPDCQDDSFTSAEDPLFWKKIQKLREAGCPIAMHGVHHVYTSTSKGLICKRPMSEFAGLPLDKQIALLNYGKQLMTVHGLDTDIFMPPGHSYDLNTLKAMKACGFRFLTDGMSSHPYEKEGIKCIPASSRYRLHFNRGLLTICIHSEAESDLSVRRTQEYLTKNKERVISFQEGIQRKTFPYWISRTEERINMMLDGVLLYLIRKVRGQ